MDVGVVADVEYPVLTASIRANTPIRMKSTPEQWPKCVCRTMTVHFRLLHEKGISWSQDLISVIGIAVKHNKIR